MPISIPEMTGALTQSNLMGGEADAAVGEAHEMLERSIAKLTECIRMNAAVLGNSTAESMMSALAYFQSAQNKISNAMREMETIQQDIRAAAELNEEYIGRLNS